MTKKTFVFWDNSNIFIGARDVAEKREGIDARFQIRIDFPRLYELAAANRKIEYAVAVGSVPPEMQHVWNRLEKAGVEVKLLERGVESGKEHGVDATLQTEMLRKALDMNGEAGIAVLLTGDGAGFYDGVGFHADLERMQKKGWGIEILSWDECCNKRMKEWAEKVGVFIRLEDFYDSITFRENFGSAIRHSKHLDLKARKMIMPGA